MASAKTKMDRVDWSRQRKKLVRGYEVIKVIGKGSYGTVYMVRKDSKERAMKEMGLKCLEAKDVEHCRQEGETMKRYSHPNLVELHEFFQIERQLYIVMEYCEGGSLKEYLQKVDRDLDEEEIIYFMVQLCKPLQYLHRKNLIHRDVKTANVFMTKDRQLKLGDMALTRECSADFAMTALAGTPIYMSPEVIEGREKYDQKADIWSLGCCFYELCHRKCLFSLATSFETLQDMIRMCKSTTIRINLCAEMNNLFKAMISYEPKNRPPVDKILQCLEAHTHDPPSPSASSRRRKKTTRGPEHAPATDQTSGSGRTHGAARRQSSNTSASSGSSSGSPTDSMTPRTSSTSPGVLESSRSSNRSPGISESSRSSNRSAGVSGSSRSSIMYSRQASGGDLHETSDYGTDTESKLDAKAYVLVEVPVLMTEYEHECYLKSAQAEHEVQRRVEAKTMKQIKQELDKWRNSDDEKKFLTGVRRLVDKETFEMCCPDLKAWWNYKSRLLKKSFKLAS